MKEFKVIKLSTPKNFSFKAALSFLDRGFDECLYNLSENAVSKLIYLSDRKGIIKIYEKESFLEIELQKRKISGYNLQEVTDYVLEWFDLSRDIEPFYSLLNKHTTLSYFTEKY